jgi:Fe2+ or Zn2+ uptake regulation protein
MIEPLICRDCGIEIVDFHDCEQHSRDTSHMIFGFRKVDRGV